MEPKKHQTLKIYFFSYFVEEIFTRHPSEGLTFLEQRQTWYAINNLFFVTGRSNLTGSLVIFMTLIQCEESIKIFW